MHPYPASVHFPIAYIVLSNSLKLGNAWRPQLLSTLSADLNIPKAAFYLQTIGLLTAVPAALTGVWECFKLRRKQGYYKRDTGKLSENARVSPIHAGFSVLAIIGAFATWFVSGPEQQEDLLVESS
jgi:uncharacterized membrane protein